MWNDSNRSDGHTWWSTTFTDGKIAPKEMRTSSHVLKCPDAKGWKTTEIYRHKFLVLSPELEFDTIRAQMLEKISESLKPKTIAFEHYSITWTIPCTQASSMPLSSPTNYQFLLDLALKQKNPSVNLMIKTRLLKNKVYPCILSGYMRQPQFLLISIYTYLPLSCRFSLGMKVDGCEFDVATNFSEWHNNGWHKRY